MNTTITTPTEVFDNDFFTISSKIVKTCIKHIIENRGNKESSNPGAGCFDVNDE